MVSSTPRSRTVRSTRVDRARGWFQVVPVDAAAVAAEFITRAIGIRVVTGVIEDEAIKDASDVLDIKDTVC